MTASPPPGTAGEPDDPGTLASPAPLPVPGALVPPSLWGSTFASLAERDFAWYFAGNLAFFMAMQMQFVLRGFLAFELTGQATALGIIAATIALPMLVAAPFGGVIADRVNKRTLLIVTQMTAAIASIVIAALILVDLIEFWHLAAVSLFTGVIFSFNMPARQAMVPQLVPQHKLMNAISLQMSGMNLTRIIAPAIGGLLIAPMGLGGVYLLTTVLFFVATTAEFKLPRHGMVGTDEPRPMREDLVGGFRYIAATPLVALLILASVLMPLFSFPLQQMLPVFAKDVFEMGPSGLGLLFSATGIGGLIGSMVAANLDRVAGKGRLMLFGAVVMGLAFLAFALMPHAVPALIFLVIGNIGGMLFMATNNTVVQASLPDEMRGRVMSVMLMSFGVMPLGVMPLTMAADVIGPQIATAISSALLLVTIGGLFMASSQLRNLRLSALAHADLSPVEAARLVAEGKLTREEAAIRTGRAPRMPEPPRADAGTADAAGT